MAAPTNKPRATRIMRAIRSLLTEMSPTNGFYIPGLVWYDGGMMRNFVEKKIDKYDEFATAMTSESLGDDRADADKGSAPTGMQRYTRAYSLHCIRTMTPARVEAGDTLDELVDELYDDVKVALGHNNQIPVLTRLKVLYEGKNHGFVSHRVMGFDVNFDAVDYPDVLFTISCEFDYDQPRERVAGG